MEFSHMKYLQLVFMLEKSSITTATNVYQTTHFKINKRRWPGVTQTSQSNNQVVCKHPRSLVSVVCDVGAVSLKNGVSLPPIPDFNLYVETPCSSLDTDHEETPVEYLIPLGVSGTRTQETAEYRLVTCPQSLTTWRPLSSCL